MVWIVGLAVPVTASYIICAVIAAPALTKLGVPDFAAHMFIFYYAVLSEVSPPTALSPFAAAAITGGDPYDHDCRRGNTRCRPFWCRSCSCSIRRASAFCMKIPKDGSWIWDIVLITAQDRARAWVRWRPRRKIGRCDRTPRPSACCGRSPGFCWCSRACWRRWRRRMIGHDVPLHRAIWLGDLRALLLKQCMSARLVASAASKTDKSKGENATCNSKAHVVSIAAPCARPALLAGAALRAAKT